MNHPVFALAIFLASAPAGAATLTTIAGFDGTGCPSGALSKDSAGDLVTILGCGGNYNYGEVLMLQKPAMPGGSWNFLTLANFDNGTAGGNPRGGLASDGKGGYFGINATGGLYAAGTMYHIPRNNAGAYGLVPVWSFGNGADGTFANGALIRVGDAVYGTTITGGANGAGMVYAMTGLNKTYGTETPIWQFANATDGGYPTGGLTADGQGGFYGTTSSGGANGSGTVFHLTPPSAGTSSWNLATLHSFNSATDGAAAEGTLLLHNGTLYGTCEGGGVGPGGTVWSLAPAAGGGSWNFTLIGSFTRSPDGAEPTVGPALYRGAVYVPVDFGGIASGAGYGTIDSFAFSKKTKQWVKTIGITFNQGNGAYPQSPLLAGPAGTFYGSTAGGILGYGSIYQLTP